MPKILEYPRSSLESALELAASVSDLGGTATLPMAAEKMDMKTGGGFYAIVSAAGKYGFLETAQKRLTTTPLYKDYKHAYSEAERATVLRKAFFNVPLFDRIYSRFGGQKLPVGLLPRILIREFDIEEAIASRLTGYFIEAARAAQLLGADDVLSRDEEEDRGQGQSEESSRKPADQGIMPPASQEPEIQSTSSSSHYVVRISGPGLNSSVEIKEEEDIAIVEIMLRKVKKMLSEGLE